MKQFVTNSTKVSGIMDDTVRFVTAYQLKDKKAWQDYIDVFRLQDDSKDLRWRGEYFGKLMRGACITYMYTKDKELYDILHWACEGLMNTQDEDGRISTYNVETEFSGWDLWCRKYVLTGLQHFYMICKDDAFKSKILKACCRHLDYIVDKIGKGKKEILLASANYGGLNSCTILEPTVELYKMTHNENYLAFAEYIISTGGCSECNLIQLVLEGKYMPYQYPVTKAYEMMSFFEGLLAYYEATGEKKYFDIADRFFEAVAKSDITIIGCAGCTHEQFDNSAIRQAEEPEGVMQETCVTVTWMRVMTRMYMLTKDTKYIDRIERSGYNALYGSLNTNFCQQSTFETSGYVEGKVFDSYAPLYMNTRGVWVGGYNTLPSGDHCGCCIAIGACGIGLMPLTAVVCDGDDIYINHQIKGQVDVKDAEGKAVVLAFDSNYPSQGLCKITVQCEETCCLNMKIRKPDWCDKMSVNAKDISNEGYYELSGTFKDKEEIVFEWPTSLKVHRLNEKVAFSYGPCVLAFDSAKSDRDIKVPVVVSDCPKYRMLDTEQGELVRVICDTEDGEILLTDYQSCGKNWLQEKNLITVWLD